MNEEKWQRKEYLLFDLDGTLTDPKLGITTCVQYALEAFGIHEPDLDKLEPFIGPPLLDSFMEFYEMDQDQAKKAVEKYRERFQDTGIFENEVYPGVPDMLRRLKKRGLHLAIASSKPTVFVERILEHFKIRQYFDVVVGSELDGRRVEKPEVVAEALRQLFPGGRIQSDKVYMIGDRKFDVEGARALGIESVGVSYGYGGMQELREAGADYIVRSVEELKRFLLRGFEDIRKDLTPFQKVWVFLYHFVIFMAVRGLVKNMGLVLLQSLGLGGDPGMGTQELALAINPNWNVILEGLGFLAGAAAIYKGAKSCIRHTICDMYLTHLHWDPRCTYLYAGMGTVGLSMGLSMLLSLSGITGGSESYQQVAQNQFGGFFLFAVITYGIISPLAEELLFRGVFYGYLRKFYDIRTAIVVSALLFGFYHGNQVQALYGAAMGYFLAYAYEYFGSYRVPVVMHLAMNLMTLTVSYTGLGDTWFCSWPVCLGFLILGGAGVWCMVRKKRLL